MKRCSKCMRDYNDDSLLYCLDDGAHLLDGPAGLDEAATAILHPSDLRAADQRTQILEPSRKLSAGIVPVRRIPLRKLAVLLVVALLATATGVGTYFYSDRFTSTQIESVAVLPFENGSGNSEFDYFSDGVSESVIDRLSQVGQLKVIARSSSFQYRDRNPKIKDIAAALGVESIVTGRVILRDDTYHIRVELIDARENKQIWGENYTRKSSDIQALQSEISREIAENLRLRLTGEQTRRLAHEGTSNPVAYEMLLKGRFHNNKLGTENRFKATEYFQQATVHDPNYALAYAELALTYTNIIVFGGSDPQEYLPKAEAAARKAIELDPQLSEGVYANAGLARYKWAWLRAESEYKRAIELNPGHARMYNGLATYLSGVGRHDEAIEVIKKGLILDPLSPLINMNYGVILYSARRYDEAISVLQKTLELDRSYPLIHVMLGRTLDAMGRYQDAVAAYQEAIRLNETSPRTQIFLGSAFAKAGDIEQGRDILRHLQSGEVYILHSDMALLLMALGERELAFDSLEKAFKAHEAQLPYIVSYPAYDSFRNDPRFSDLLNGLALPQ